MRKKHRGSFVGIETLLVGGSGGPFGIEALKVMIFAHLPITNCEISNGGNSRRSRDLQN